MDFIVLFRSRYALGIFVKGVTGARGAPNSAALQTHSVFRKAISALRSSSDNLNPNGWPFTA
jgi:hypothetical protein